MLVVSVMASTFRRQGRWIGSCCSAAHFGILKQTVHVVEVTWCPPTSYPVHTLFALDTAPLGTVKAVKLRYPIRSLPKPSCFSQFCRRYVLLMFQEGLKLASSRPFWRLLEL